MIDRFMSKTMPEPNTGCWLWTGSYFNSGYGRFAETSKQTVLAHRFSYRAFRGGIPAGLMVCHKCDTPACVNPDHLFVASAQENMSDKVRKGRQSKGAQVYKTKLTEDQVRQIRQRHGDRVIDLSREFGVLPTHIRNIQTGRSWGWLSP